MQTPNRNLMGTVPIKFWGQNWPKIRTGVGVRIWVRTKKKVRVGREIWEGCVSVRGRG